MPSSRWRAALGGSRWILAIGVGLLAIGAGLAIGVGGLLSAPQTRASVSYVQSASGSISGSSLRVGYGAKVKARDLLVGQFRTNGRTSVADSVNGPWTEAVQTEDNGVTHSVWFRENVAAGATTVMVSGASRGALRAMLAEYAGVALRSALDTSSCRQGIATSANTGASIPIEAGELLYASLGAFEHPLTVTGGSSANADATLRRQFSAASGTGAEEDVTSTAGGTQNASFRLSAPAPGGWAACLATFRRLQAPAVVWLPVLSGPPRSGAALRTTNGAWANNPNSFTYAWRRCDAGGSACTKILGARASTYQEGQADVGHTLRSVVKAVNAGGSGEPAVSDASAVVSAR